MIRFLFCKKPLEARTAQNPTKAHLRPFFCTLRLYWRTFGIIETLEIIHVSFLIVAVSPTVPCTTTPPCQNGATCTESNTGPPETYTCTCVLGYTGDNCAISKSNNEYMYLGSERATVSFYLVIRWAWGFSSLSRARKNKNSSPCFLLLSGIFHYFGLEFYWLDENVLPFPGKFEGKKNNT